MTEPAVVGVSPLDSSRICRMVELQGLPVRTEGPEPQRGPGQERYAVGVARLGRDDVVSALTATVDTVAKPPPNAAAVEKIKYLADLRALEDDRERERVIRRARLGLRLGRITREELDQT